MHEGGDRKVASEIAGRTTPQNPGAKIGISGVSVQRRSERVAHLRVEIDSVGAAQRNDCDSIGHARGQNVGGHGILLSCDHLFFNGALHALIRAPYADAGSSRHVVDATFSVTASIAVRRCFGLRLNPPAPGGSLTKPVRAPPTAE